MDPLKLKALERSTANDQTLDSRLQDEDIVELEML
jgi:hypothetical protein